MRESGRGREGGREGERERRRERGRESERGSERVREEAEVSGGKGEFFSTLTSQKPTNHRNHKPVISGMAVNPPFLSLNTLELS